MIQSRQVDYLRYYRATSNCLLREPSHFVSIIRHQHWCHRENSTYRSKIGAHSCWWDSWWDSHVASVELRTGCHHFDEIVNNRPSYKVRFCDLKRNTVSQIRYLLNILDTAFSDISIQSWFDFLYGLNRHHILYIQQYHESSLNQLYILCKSNKGVFFLSHPEN